MVSYLDLLEEPEQIELFGIVLGFAPLGKNSPVGSCSPALPVHPPHSHACDAPLSSRLPPVFFYS